MSPGTQRPLRAFLDARCAGTGIGTYVTAAAEAMLSLGPAVECSVLFGPRWGPAVPAAAGRRFVACGSRPYGIAEQVSLPWLCRRADLLHMPLYNVPIAHRGPLVVTIHDLTQLGYPGSPGRLATRVYAAPMVRIATRRAHSVIAVSQFIRRRIINELGADPARVRLIYNGINPALRFPQRETAAKRAAEIIGTRDPYILYVGNAKPHKGLPTLFKAFARWRAQHSHACTLVVVLGATSPPPQHVLPNHAVLVNYAPLHDLAALYAAARALVFPSLSEGFGYPLVEAMAAGTPVICSDASALPEIAGSAARLFKAGDPDALAAALSHVLNDRACWERLRAAGLERAAFFSWARCVEAHAALYREILFPNSHHSTIDGT